MPKLKVKREQPAAVLEPDVLATLTPEERTDYIIRQNLHNQKVAALQLAHADAKAAAHYLDLIGEELKERYDLPSAYSLNLETGEITAVESVVVDASDG